MRSAVNAIFFLAMIPLGLMAAELGHRTSNVQDSATGVAEYRLLRRGTRRRERGGGGRNRDAEDSPELPSALPSATPTDTPADNDMETLLDLHNEARCLHNSDPLTYSDKVALSAKAHAEFLSSSCGDFYHSEREDRNGYGENLYLCWGTGSGSCYTPERAMTGLYDDEVKVNKVTEYGGHATQILWKSTTELGCAVATCSKNSYRYVYLVCQYNPPGNYMAIVKQEVELASGASC